MFYALACMHALTSKARRPKILLPRQSVPLTDSEYDEARRACLWAKEAVEGRDAYIAVQKLDPSIHNPAANWSLDNSFYDGYRALASHDYDCVNMLRVFSQMFTGVFLGVKFTPGMPVPRQVPPDLDTDLDGWLNGRFFSWRHKLAALLTIEPQLKLLKVRRIFGETGFIEHETVVNHDTYVYTERAALLLRSGLVDRLRRKEHPVILEIGSGYGALAEFIRQMVPDCRYICLDLPESIIFSAVYLSRLYPGPLLMTPDTDPGQLTRCDTAFVPNYMFNRLVESGATVDLAINTLSMSEMTDAQIEAYCLGLKALLGGEGLFFEQNNDNRHIGLSHAAGVIAKHFPARIRIKAPFKITQGTPHIWANADAALRGLALRRT